MTVRWVADMHPIPTIRTECGTAAIVPALTGEQRRADLENDLSHELCAALRLDKDVVIDHGYQVSRERASDFVRECGNADADRFLAQLVGKLTRSSETDAVLASLGRRWVTTVQGLAVKELADLADDGKRITFEPRQ